MTDNLLSSMLRELTEMKTTGVIAQEEYEVLKMLMEEIYTGNNKLNPL
jgi:hypothetical protein